MWILNYIISTGAFSINNGHFRREESTFVNNFYFDVYLTLLKKKKLKTVVDIVIAPSLLKWPIIYINQEK